MLVCVTGATGHVGCNVVRLLLTHGHTVRIMRWHGDHSTSLDGLEVQTVLGDVRDKTSVQAAVDGCDAVIHLAAMISINGDPTGIVRDINVDGARNVAEACLEAGVGRLVHFSSVHAFDLTTGALIDESGPRPPEGHPAYDRSKAAGEAAVREVVAKGLNAVFLNPAGVIGPNDFAPSRMGKVLIDFHQGRYPAISPGGFDWVDCRDVAAAAVSALTRGNAGENYILTGTSATLAEVLEASYAVTGRPPPPVLSRPLLNLAVPVATLIQRLIGQRPTFTWEAMFALLAGAQIDGGKARRELGHAPRPLEETVEDALHWFESRGMITRPLRGAAPAAKEGTPVPPTV